MLNNVQATMNTKSWREIRSNQLLNFQYNFQDIYFEGILYFNKLRLVEVSTEALSRRQPSSSVDLQSPPRKRLSYRRHVRFHSRIGRNNKSRLSWGQLEVTRTNQRHVAITELRHKLARELPRRPGSPTKILWLPRVTPVSRHRSLPRDPRRSSTFHTSIHSSGYRPDPCRVPPSLLLSLPNQTDIVPNDIINAISFVLRTLEREREREKEREREWERGPRKRGGRKISNGRSLDISQPKSG